MEIRRDAVACAYVKHRNFIENILFPALLILYPLTGIRQGIDVADSTYSLANFQYFPSMNGTWMVATFLANGVGNLLTRLPFGGTLMGMYFYTALFQSATALMAYEAFRKKPPVRMSAPLVFVGEWIALGLCWCPSTILYNYLTYLFMTAGVLLLYNGILKDNPRSYVAAGIFLGANVAVRMPNVVQAAFILAVWYGAALRRRTWQQAFRDTLWCMLGYAIGFGAPFAAICARYGAGAYPAMVRTLFAMTEKAADYKPGAMVTGMIGDYMVGLYWLLFAGICMAGGWLLFALQRRLFADRRGAGTMCTAVYGAVLLVLIRFYWGRGVFSFRYYEYGSMYYPAVMLLLAAVFAAVCCLSGKSVCAEQKILAALVLLQIFVTPLGSNNALYPAINNLYIVVPFTLWTAYSRLTDDKTTCGTWARTWRIPFVMLVMLVLVQSTGFHLCFSFQDGIHGEARDAKLAAPAKAAGVYTNQDNAAWLSELSAYVEGAGLAGREVILYGEVPGLGYLLDMPSALSTFWADLDSYLVAEYERDMAQLKAHPVVITSAPVAAYLNEDADGVKWSGVNEEKLAADEKLQMLGGYMEEHSYREVFGNGRYVVYLAE